MSPVEERRVYSALTIAEASADAACPATSASAAVVVGFSMTGEIVCDQRRAPECTSLSWYVTRNASPPLQIAGDDIVCVQLPPGFGRIGGAFRARRPADDAPQVRAACDVLRFLADALGERVVLRVAGHVGER